MLERQQYPGYKVWNAAASALLFVIPQDKSWKKQSLGKLIVSV